jgi:hypothetical protein
MCVSLAPSWALVIMLPQLNMCFQHGCRQWLTSILTVPCALSIHLLHSLPMTFLDCVLPSTSGASIWRPLRHPRRFKCIFFVKNIIWRQFNEMLSIVVLLFMILCSWYMGIKVSERYTASVFRREVYPGPHLPHYFIRGPHNEISPG